MGKNHIRYIFFVLICLTCAVILSGCSKEKSDNSIIRFAIANAPSSLDPRFATDASSERINHLIYSSLVKFDSNLLPVPSLAKWEKLDPQTYRFYLLPDRPDFSNGQKITAGDVVASFRYILDPDNLSPHRESVAMIRNIKEIDADTIEFSLYKPDALFPAYLNTAILPANLIESGHDFNMEPVGSGPFILLKKRSQHRLMLERRADFHLVEFIQVKDPTVRVLKLLNHEIDVLQNDLSPEIMRYLSAQDGIKVISRQGSNFTYIGFNLDDPLTGNANIRNAISLAIDRNAIIKYAFNQAAVSAEAMLPPGHWAGHPSLPKIKHDPQRAKKILSALGYSLSKPLELTYKTSSDPFRIKLATIIQSQLAEVGIHITIQSYDWGTFFGDIKAGNFQMYSLSWVGINTPDIFRYVFHSDSVPPAGANRGRYKSRKVDELLGRVSLAESLDEQAVIYRQIQELLLEELPYIPMWYENQQAFMNRQIVGYELSSDGNYESLEKTYRRKIH